MGASTKVVLTKVAMDQLLFAPTFLAIFIVSFNALKGTDWLFIKKELSNKYLDILTVNYTIWPLIQMVNFFVVPLKHQVLFVQSIAVLWNTYLCWKTQHQH